MVEILTKEVFYTPYSIVATYSSILNSDLEREILKVKGIYQRVEGTNYGGYFYDKLKEESSDVTIKLLVPALVRDKVKPNSLVEFFGFLTKKIDKAGRIELQLTLSEVIEQRVSKYSDEDVKKIDILNKKLAGGFKDVDSFIKDAIYNNRKVTIKVIIGRTGIIDADILKQLAEGVSLYDISFERISLFSSEEIYSSVLSLDGKADMICIARGGGENLEIFDKPELVEKVTNLESLLVSAIGHAVNVTLFEKIADKKFSTPSAFGSYLREIYNTTIEELNSSKAKLTKDITDQLKTNYEHQIKTLNDKVASTDTLYKKTLDELKIAALEKEKLLTAQLQNTNSEKEKRMHYSHKALKKLEDLMIGFSNF